MISSQWSVTSNTGASHSVLVIITLDPEKLCFVYKLVFLLFLLFGGLKKFNIKLKIDLNFKEFSKMSNSISNNRKSKAFSSPFGHFSLFIFSFLVLNSRKLSSLLFLVWTWKMINCCIQFSKTVYSHLENFLAIV